MKTLLSWWNMASDKGALIVVLVLAILLLIGLMTEFVPRLSLKKVKAACVRKFRAEAA